ncbi:MAG TPA: hypothetical protein DCF33_05995, partial [Saprospirales bacterium]|nr:hypothetical protein [Saprospirales bacterium]
WIFKDASEDNTFTLPDPTVLSAGEYLVIYRNQDSFALVYPTITNIAGPFAFGLSNAGDALRLYDASGRLYQSVYYGTENPWPTGADGNGYTLELVDSIGNPNLPQAWMDGCLKGSPGGPFAPCQTSATSQPFGQGTLGIFPNPNQGEFTLQAEGLNDSQPFDLSIWDATGRLVQQQNGIQQRSKFRLGRLAQGVYWVLVAQEGRVCGGRGGVIQ